MAAMMQEWFNMIAAQPHLETVASGNTADSTAIAHFNSNGQLPLKKCVINLTPSLDGYTSATLDYRGRNLLISIGPSNNSVFALNADGSVTADGTLGGSSWFIWNTSVSQVTSSSTQYVQTRLLPNGRYRYPYGDYVDGNHRTNTYPQYSLDLSNYDGTNERKGVHASVDSEYCITVDDTYKYNWMRIYQSKGNTYSNYTFYPRIFLASENDYSWEPCNWRKFTTTFDNKIYGGSLDLVSGKLIVDVGCVDLGTLTWSLSESTRYASTGLYGIIEQPSTVRTAWGLCSDLTVITDGRAYSDVPDKSIYLAGGGKWLYVHLADAQDASQVPTLLSGIKYVYKLLNPITYQLTPQEITTLAGVNNVWSDQGLVELAYWTQSNAATETDIKDIKVYLNNAAYPGPNGLATSNYIEDSRFFIAGPFDTGSEESKTYTFSTCPISTVSGGAAVQLYNDLSANSVDYDAVTRTSTTSVTSALSGRYVLCSVCKSYADTSYMYYTVDGVKHYLFKGSKVT